MTNSPAFQAARLVASLALGAGIAAAGPVINVIYDPGVAFTAADKTEIQNALAFYTTNITNSFAVTIAFGSQAGGGASTTQFVGSVNYSDYYNALLGSSSLDATDIAAIASLGGFSGNNPVTGSTGVRLSTTQMAAMGLGSNASTSWSQCGNQTANVCIQLGLTELNLGGSPSVDLFGVVQHEVDEVLGTASSLPNGGGSVPTNPSAADLFRYSASGVRGFALNPSTNVPCTGSPVAYFSLNSGATNLDSYNNCNNGGDYGDWIYIDDGQVQDAFGSGTVASSLNLGSTEVKLLDAVGYNFDLTATPEPSSVVTLLSGLAAIPMLRRRLGRG